VVANKFVLPMVIHWQYCHEFLPCEHSLNLNKEIHFGPRAAELTGQHNFNSIFTSLSKNSDVPSILKREATMSQMITFVD
jgi:hypothetical protein